MMEPDTGHDNPHNASIDTSEKSYTTEPRSHTDTADALAKIVRQRPLGFADRPAFILSIISIVFGVLCMVMEIIISCLTSLWNSGGGIWCGLVFIGVGVMGVFACRNKQRLRIKIFMGLTIIAVIFAAILIGLSIKGFRVHFYCNRSYIDPDRNLNICEWYYAAYILHIILVTLGVFELFIMFACCAICVMTIFGREKQKGMIYVPGHSSRGQPVMIAIPPRA
ncbi:PREDICTED: uncharacterized protein LOC106809663 [Priapulus caudatus]|uniref:Uncharacterized protein LOC106809663 n=1 Tax=Priapulus caudatus TaxID=37621 RepID=A0ABM1E7Z3_PRICU|nr:PREDICTED: uncharacterized protein LOC106809663 [Priapulus caudatus]